MIHVATVTRHDTIHASSRTYRLVFAFSNTLHFSNASTSLSMAAKRVGSVVRFR